MTARRVLVWTAGLLLLLGLWWNTRSRETLVSPRADVRPPPSSPTAPAHRPAPMAAGDTATVTRVIDGDTVELQDGRVVRYVGIDAPEVGRGRKGPECFADEAAAENRHLVRGREVRLERDVSERDRYGRLLRYVYVDQIPVNEALVRKGYARSSSFPPDARHQDRLRSAERDAKANRRGLWGEACSSRRVKKL